MAKYIAFSLLLVLGFLSSCQKEQIAPTTPNASALAAQQAKARLTAQPKWIVDEALVGGKLAYKRGQTNAKDADMELEWCRFADTGIFEVKYIDNPTIEQLYYRVEEATDRVVISEDKAFTQPDYFTTIRTGSVEAGKFEMEMPDGTETLLLKMIPMP